MGILAARRIMRVTKEAVLVVLFASLVCGIPVPGPPRVVRSPQQITQEVLLTPFNLVRNTGNTAIQTGTDVVNAVPSAVDTVSNTAVTGVNIVPQTVDAVSDLTVDTINAVPATVDNVATFGVNSIRNAPSNAVTLANGVPTFANSAFNTLRNAPGQFVSFGSNALSTAGRVPSTAFRMTNGAFQAGANALRNTPGAFTSFANNAVQTGTGFVRQVPQNIVSAPQTFIGAGATGVRTVANDGMSMLTSIPRNALQLTGTAFRTGGALVNGGTRLVFATGDSLLRTGLNTVNGGGRVLLATADSGMRMAGNAFNRVRQLF